MNTRINHVLNLYEYLTRNNFPAPAIEKRIPHVNKDVLNYAAAGKTVLQNW